MLKDSTGAVFVELLAALPLLSLAAALLICFDLRTAAQLKHAREGFAERFEALLWTAEDLKDGRCRSLRWNESCEVHECSIEGASGGKRALFLAGRCTAKE